MPQQPASARQPPHHVTRTRNKGSFPPPRRRRDRVGVRGLDLLGRPAHPPLQDSAIGQVHRQAPQRERLPVPIGRLGRPPEQVRLQLLRQLHGLPLPDKFFSGAYAAGEQTTPLKASQVIDAASKILLIDESTDTVDDGCWAWQQAWAAVRTSSPTGTTRARRRSRDLNAGRGNANFCDGHAELVFRKASFDPFYFDPLRRQ